MGLHNRDLTLLLLLRQFLGGVGTIHENSTLNKVNYSIDSKKDILVLISHFSPPRTNYPLLTQKGADFIMFKEVVRLMNNKTHLSIQGLNQIINIKASMNLGLSDFLKYEFLSVLLPRAKFVPVAEGGKDKLLTLKLFLILIGLQVSATQVMDLLMLELLNSHLILLDIESN